MSSRGIIHLASAVEGERAAQRPRLRDVEDVREIAPYVLRHRIIVEAGMTHEEALATVLERIPVPEISQSLVYA